VHKHVPFEFRIVKETFFAARVDALEKLIAMHCHVLLQRCSVTENLSARGQMALKRLESIGTDFCGLFSHHRSASLAKHRIAELFVRRLPLLLDLRDLWFHRQSFLDGLLRLRCLLDRTWLRFTDKVRVSIVIKVLLLHLSYL
jgi:hypothetical protein